MLAIDWETSLSFEGADDCWHVKINLLESGRSYDLSFKSYEDAALCEAKWILELSKSSTCNERRIDQ